MTTVDLGHLSIAEAAEGYRRHDFSPVELTRALLDRIERLNPTLNAFVTVTADRALSEARDAEARLLRGDDDSPLLGIPVAHKDIIATAGIRTTAGSALLTDWSPDKDATVVTRWQAAGTVLLGKLITHEFPYVTLLSQSAPRRRRTRTPRGPACASHARRVRCGW